MDLKKLFRFTYKYLPKVFILLYLLNFIVNNLQTVYLVFWPFNDYPIYVPLSLLLSITATLGIMVGGFVMWREGKTARQLADIRKQQVALLEKENADLYDQLQREKALNKK